LEEEVGEGFLLRRGWSAYYCEYNLPGTYRPLTKFVQLPTAMDAVRIDDGSRIILKTVLPEESPHELLITQLFSSPGLKGDPKNHCVPLLDLIYLSRTSPDGRKLMVIPFLHPFKDPRSQTYGEFVAFFSQISEVRPNTLLNSIC
jgi:hypothetical protein